MVAGSSYIRRMLGLICGVVLSMAALSRADIFHLEGGDAIEAEFIEDRGDVIRVRTLLGIVDIEKSRIVKREQGITPWEAYEKIRRKVKETPQAHYKLAAWCHNHKLTSESKYHLQRVIELDPDHAKARRRLGYVKEDGKWVRKKPDNAPTPEELDERKRAKNEAKIIQKAIAQWHVRIAAIYRGKLKQGDGDGITTGRRGKQYEKFQEGRRLILGIHDPLAIPALTKILCAGNMPTRRLLVETLGQFAEDEATMNLLVLAVLDPAPDVRNSAALELLRRDDPRTIEHLRKALHNEDEDILRNAATVLGIMKAHSAAEDLISVLSTVERRRVLVSRPVFLNFIHRVYGCGCRYPYGRRYIIYRPESIGVLCDGTMVGTRSHYEMQNVSVYRTEVQEALIAITGQNFGFDELKWRQWFIEQDRLAAEEAKQASASGDTQTAANDDTTIESPSMEGSSPAADSKSRRP